MPNLKNTLIKQYGAIRLADFKLEEPGICDIGDATHVRVDLPANADFGHKMHNMGYLLADRTVKMSIRLTKLPDVSRTIRVQIEACQCSQHKDTILGIALDAFPYDRRFHILPKCDSNIAKLVLSDWIDSCGEILVCKNGDEISGFLDMVHDDSETAFLRLVATTAKYRLSGCGPALYAKACLLAREQGLKKVEGRTSTQNMAALNIYASLGASFSEPRDIFLKEVRRVA